MKKNDDMVRALASVLSRFLVAISLIMTVPLVGAHNNVVVVPLGGDEAREPTSPVALVDPSQTDYNLFLVGSTIDNTTGLQWQRQDDNALRDWDLALDYCATLTLSGSADWRLPDVVELQSIADFGQSSPAITGAAFPGTNSSNYWSASSVGFFSNFAWVIDFETGAVVNAPKSTSLLVRCVR